MGESNYAKVKGIVLELCADRELRGKLIIAGGTVPYLVSGRESGRVHSDIDVVVEQRDMEAVRTYLKSKHLYEKDMDSREFAFNSSRLDYGVNGVIDGVTVNFAPCEEHEGGVSQRNFLTKEHNGFQALVTVGMERVALKEMVDTVLVEGREIRLYRLEVVKIMKEKSKKRKDKEDIAVIEAFGYDGQVYMDLKRRLKTMKFQIKPENRLLRFLFR